MEIDPRQLRYLLAIGRTGSFVKAAEALNISQPALSVAISRLEDILGVQVVERGRQGARLNAAGEALARHAESVETVLRTARTEIDLQEHGISGPFAVGGTPLATASIIPDILARLTREFGTVNIQVAEDSDEGLIERLMRHELDLVVANIGLNPRPDEISHIPLFKARAIVVVRPGHPIEDRATLSLEELEDFTWVMPPQGGSFRMLLEALFTTNGRPFPTNIIEAAPFSVLKEIVRRSDGVTVLSDQIAASELRESLLVAIPLKEQIAPRVFGLHFLGQRLMNPLARRFLQLARETASDYDIGP